ncbi:MAG: hypothetical protein ABH852_04530 [Methanobacteriota archaeon]
MIDVVGYAIMGLILLIVPGFLFSTVLYPKVGSLDFWARIGVSLGLGTMLAVIVGYTISMPGVSTLSMGPFVIAALVVCIVLAILTYFRGGFAVLSAYKSGAVKILHLRMKVKESKPRTPEEPQTKTPEEPKPITPEEPQTKTPEEPKTTP